MGACYSVALKAKLLDESGAIKALQEHIANDTGVNYSLDDLAKEGTTTETFDGLMRIFLAGWKICPFTVETDKDFVIYTNDFDASYGWEMVMIDMFYTLTPFLDNKSEFIIDIDDEYDRFIIRNGKCVQLH